MSHKTRLVIIGVIALLTGLWLVVMYRLSSADGARTLQDSMFFAEKLAPFIWDNPTGEQLWKLNLLLRKLAHVGLYLVLGGLIGLLWNVIISRQMIFTKAIISMLSVSAIGFADEYMKLSVSGRHFSFDEAVLNCLSGCSVIAVITVVVFIRKIIKAKKTSCG